MALGFQFPTVYLYTLCYSFLILQIDYAVRKTTNKNIVCNWFVLKLISPEIQSPQGGQSTQVVYGHVFNAQLVIRYAGSRVAFVQVSDGYK